MLESNLTAAAWAPLMIAWILAVVSPGPDVFLLLRLGVRDRRAAVLAALGIMTGNLLWIVCSVLGISALIAAFPWMLPAVQLIGAAVLTWLGVQSLRGGIAALRRPAEADAAPGPRRPYALGFVTNIANPKALIFFTSLLGQFLPADATLTDRALVIAAMTATGLLWFVSAAVACSSQAFRRWFRRAAPWFDIAAGAVFCLVAAFVLVELAVHALGG